MPPEDGEAPIRTSRPGIDPSVTELESRIGCALPDAALAVAALTHKSYVNEHRTQALSDNERLEFLGDAVIDLAVAHRLMERFPDAREGDLSKLRAAVVDEAGLASMARALDIGPLLRLGRGEELTGGREKSSLLADAMEAVVAAVYLSGGLDPVLRLVDRFLGEAFARAAAGTLDRDFKTQFQELAQSRLRSTPRYRVVAEHGPDHSKTFEVELELRGEVVGRGTGRSKKDAEQSAARGAIDAVNGRFGVEARSLQLSPAPPCTPLPESATDVEAAAPVDIVQTVEQVETVDAPAAPLDGADGDTPRAPAPRRAKRTTVSARTTRVTTSRAVAPRKSARKKPAGKARGRGAAPARRAPRRKR